MTIEAQCVPSSLLCDLSLTALRSLGAVGEEGCLDQGFAGSMHRREREPEADNSDGPWDLSWARKEAGKSSGGFDKGWGTGQAASIVATSGAVILRPK